jgi:hypothetical protein
LSEEERFRELDLLVRDYDAIIAGLQEGKDTYEAFFTQLVAGIRQAVKRKSDEIRQLEQERAALHQSAVAQQDHALEQWVTQSADQLQQSVRLLGQATLLLLKKVETLVAKRIRWDSSSPIRGGCMICMAMCGNGYRIGMGRILQGQSEIHRVPHQALPGCVGVGVGPPVLKAVGYRSAMGSHQAAA